MMSLKRVLIVGGTGYLGQHLLQSLGISYEAHPPFSLAFTYNSEPPPQLLLDALPHALPFHVDMRTGDGLDAISNLFGQPDVVLNCAAISVPRACEMDPEAAMAINVPTAVVKWLLSFKENKTLLIHLSTDQVYEGTKSFYKEEDDVAPVNVYGKSKVEAEQFVSAKYPNFAILRSSIIYGPQTIAPLTKSLPIQQMKQLPMILMLHCDLHWSYIPGWIQTPYPSYKPQKDNSWMDSVLSKGETLDFFHDEFRCPVYVKDLVNVTRILIDRWISEHKQMQLLLNVGGPDRVSRVQMAEAVANVRGYNTSLINQVSASSVDRGVKSPADISMDVTKLIQTLGVSPTSYTEGVTLTLNAIPQFQQSL